MAKAFAFSSMGHFSSISAVSMSIVLGPPTNPNGLQVMLPLLSWALSGEKQKRHSRSIEEHHGFIVLLGLAIGACGCSRCVGTGCNARWSHLHFLQFCNEFWTLRYAKVSALSAVQRCILARQHLQPGVLLHKENWKPKGALELVSRYARSAITYQSSKGFCYRTIGM